jgi:hypothetical protein
MGNAITEYAVRAEDGAAEGPRWLCSETEDAGDSPWESLV